MIIFPALAMIPETSANPMSYVGSYSYASFATAPLMTGDFAVYYSNFPGTEPTGGSGNDWYSWDVGNGVNPGAHSTYVATKVLESGDIGVSPTNNNPAGDTDARFIVYRGPGSVLLKKINVGTSATGFVKDVKHCGLLMSTQRGSGVTYQPATPATWASRRSQTSTFGGTSLTGLRLWDRIEPANEVYVDNEAFALTASGSGGNAHIFEFLVP